MPAKPLNERTKKALKEKAEGTRFTYGELAQSIAVDKVHICRAAAVTFLWQHGLWVA